MKFSQQQSAQHEMATSFTVTGLYQDRPAKRGTLQDCCFNLLVSLVQADHATGLAELSDGHGLCQGKTRVKAKMHAPCRPPPHT